MAHVHSVMVGCSRLFALPISMDSEVPINLVRRMQVEWRAELTGKLTLSCELLSTFIATFRVVSRIICPDVS
jgi:hypothetical protein